MITFKILFWNAAGTADVTHLVELAQQHEPDIIIVAEPSAQAIDTVAALNVGDARLFQLPFNLSERLQFFVSLPPDSVQPLADDFGVSVRHVRPVIGEDFVLVAVHLGSKQHLSTEEQGQLAARIRETITEAEQKVGHARTVVVGDFNMDPFDAGVVSSEGLHAIMSREVVSRLHRTVLGRKRLFLYNPMWSLIGDTSAGPPGTYHYDSSSPINYYWHTFDQVLLRPALAASFQTGDVEVLSSAGNVSLMGTRRRPARAISDHFPILARIRLQEVANGAAELVG